MKNMVVMMESHTACARALEELEERRDYGQASPTEISRLLNIAEGLGDESLIWRARRLAAELAGRRGDLAQAIRELRRVQQYAAANGQARLLARAHLNLAWVFRDIGDLSSYIDHAVQAVEQLDAAAPANVRSHHLTRLADALDECGSRSEAKERYIEAELVAERAGDVTRQVTCLNNRAYGEYLAGELEQSQATIARLMDICTKNDLPLRAHTLDTIARIYISAGRYDEAVEMSLKATEAFRQQGVLEVLAPAEFLLTRATAERLRGRHSAAQAGLDECRAIGVEAKLASLLAAVDEEQSQLHAARGDFEKAYLSYREFYRAEKALLSEQRAAQSRMRQAVLETAEARAQADRYRDEAIHDPLTGLPNRRYVDDRLTRDLAAVAAPNSLAVALIDLDHFKRVNDRCSHAAGDEVLKALARLLEAELSQWRTRTGGDGYAARMGGEEFLVVLLTLTGGPGGVARDHIETIRSRVDDYDWTPITGNLPVTLSAGVSYAKDNDSQYSLLRRADELLYRAKHAGRNRVFHEEGPRDARPSPVGPLQSL